MLALAGAGRLSHRCRREHRPHTKRFSDLIGARGRVIAFAPVPATFEMLATNAAQFACANVTPLNLAGSDATG